MANLIQQYVKRNGTGDYTDLIAGISGIVASGIASGDLIDLYLYVDSGYYTGSFNITVPNSGGLHILGSGTWFEPSNTCYISGIYVDQSNFSVDNLKIVCSSLLIDAFSIREGTRVEFNSVDFLQPKYAINNLGDVFITNSNACGKGSGYFINNNVSGYSNITNSTIGDFVIGLSGNVAANRTRLINNNYAVQSVGNIYLSNSLIRGESGIILTSGTITASHNTIDTSGLCFKLRYINNVYIVSSILGSQATFTISGINATGIVSGCCFYNSGYYPGLDLSGVNISGNPIYNNSSILDYRLRLKETVGSPCIEVLDQGLLHPDVSLITDQSQLILNDIRGRIPFDTYKNFVYKQGNTLLFSDYEKEVKFAELLSNYTLSRYTLYTQAKFSVSNISLTPAIDGSYKPFPYDWDFKKFNTTEITSDTEYIIPRSILDVATAIGPYVGDWLDNVVFSQLKKTNITPYIYKNYRGVSFDYDGSGPGQSIMWSIEGRNQLLTKSDAFTGEIIEEFPLLIAERATKHIYPSGLIAAGVFGDKYKYILSTDPNTEFLSESNDGRFNWLATEIDNTKDLRGILAYKNNLYVTLTEYNDTIIDRSSTPTPPVNSGVGKILMYSNNHIFEHYIANYSMDYAPVQMQLDRNNAYPTDITIYEDGTVYVADYLNISGFYKYKFAYDYALIQSSYDKESKVLLREDYDNVEL